LQEIHSSGQSAPLKKEKNRSTALPQWLTNKS
jgi:hypothetical protein